LANVLACREALLATTHQLDRKRKAICVAIEEVGGTQKAAPIKHPKDRQGKPESIMGYLKKTDSSFVKRSEIESMLADLQDNGLVEKLEGAGDNGRNLYQFQSWQSLGTFDITDDFKSTFADCTDPFSGDNFVETARAINADLKPTAGDFMGSSEVTSSAEESQATLTGETATVDVDLAPHEELVADLLRENLDGETISNLDEHEPSIREMLGLVELGEDDDAAQIDDTILDPEHGVWQHGPDEWADTVSAVEEEIENALRVLTQEGIFNTSTTKTRAGKPVEMTVSVKDV
jgi:hypothetical protein